MRILSFVVALKIDEKMKLVVFTKQMIFDGALLNFKQVVKLVVQHALRGVRYKLLKVICGDLAC